MVHFDSQAAQYLCYFVAAVAGVALLVIALKIGDWLASSRYRQHIERNQKDLFTAQAGFKKLYEGEIHAIKTDNARLKAENEYQQREIARLTKAMEDLQKQFDEIKVRLQQLSKGATGHTGMGDLHDV